MDDAPMAPTTPLLLQEVLRTLGLGLEMVKVRPAELVIDPEGVAIYATGEYGQRHYDRAEIASQSHTQQSQRRPGERPPPRTDPWALSRWSVMLRVAGLLLDAQGVRACTVQATVAKVESDRDCQLTMIAGGREVLDGVALQEHIRWLRLRRGTQYVPEEPPPKRPWWARSRRS